MTPRLLVQTQSPQILGHSLGVNSFIRQLVNPGKGAGGGRWEAGAHGWGAENRQLGYHVPPGQGAGRQETGTQPAEEVADPELGCLP